MIEVTLKLVANKSNWTTLAQQIAVLENWFLTQSNNRIKVKTDVVHTAFDTIPFTPYEWGPDYWGIDHDWYNQNVLPHGIGYTMVLFLVNYSQWKDLNKARGWRTDMDAGPVELQITALQNEAATLGTLATRAFVFLSAHEMSHGLYMIQGGVDNTHKWWDAKTPEKIFDDFNYALLENKINKKKGDTMIIAKAQGNPTLYLQAGDTLVGFVDYETYLKLVEGREVQIVEMPAAELAKFKIAPVVLKK